MGNSHAHVHRHSWGTTLLFSGMLSCTLKTWTRYSAPLWTEKDGLLMAEINVLVYWSLTLLNTWPRSHRTVTFCPWEYSGRWGVVVECAVTAAGHTLSAQNNSRPPVSDNATFACCLTDRWEGLCDLWSWTGEQILCGCRSHQMQIECGLDWSGWGREMGEAVAHKMMPDSQKGCQSVKECKKVFQIGVIGFARIFTQISAYKRKTDGKAIAKSISFTNKEFLFMWEPKK